MSNGGHPMANPVITPDELCEKLGKPKGYFDSILRESYLAEHRPPTPAQIAGYYRRGAQDALEGRDMDDRGCVHYRKGYEDARRDFIGSLDLYMQDREIPFSTTNYLERLK